MSIVMLCQYLGKRLCQYLNGEPPSVMFWKANLSHISRIGIIRILIHPPAFCVPSVGRGRAKGRPGRNQIDLPICLFHFSPEGNSRTQARNANEGRGGKRGVGGGEGKEHTQHTGGRRWGFLSHVMRHSTDLCLRREREKKVKRKKKGGRRGTKNT